MLDFNYNYVVAGLTGNIVKLALGILSASYDTIFMVQRFILYPPDKTVQGSSTTYSPLLLSREDHHEFEEA